MRFVKLTLMCLALFRRRHRSTRSRSRAAHLFRNQTRSYLKLHWAKKRARRSCAPVGTRTSERPYQQSRRCWSSVDFGAEPEYSPAVFRSTF